MKITKKLAKIFLNHEGYNIKGIINTENSSALNVIDGGISTIKFTFKEKNTRRSEINYEVYDLEYVKKYLTIILRTEKFERILNKQNNLD